jgi:hypothetical protein
VISAAFYIIYFLVMKALGLTHITALRAVNYLMLFAVCFYGIKKWVSQTGHFIPFLTVFATTFFTGIFSFLLFSVFLLYYSQFDSSFTQMMTSYVPAIFREIPSLIIFCEGAAVSIIIGFINMQYFRRYEEGEVSPEKEMHHKDSVENESVNK